MEQNKSTAAALRSLLKGPEFLIMPCCYDALSATLIQQAGFSLTFMSGFAVSAARLGLPDTGLISYGEMADQLRDICGIARIPVIADGDLQSFLGFPEYDETLNRLEGEVADTQQPSFNQINK